MALKKSSKRNIIVGGALLVALIVAIVAFFSYGVATIDPKDAQTSVTKPSPTASATPDPGCAPAYQQVVFGHSGNMVNESFEEKFTKATSDVTTLSQMSTALQNLLLEQTGQNVVSLAAYAHRFGLYADPNNTAPLVADNCLSLEGQKLHNQLEGVLKANSTKVEMGVAPVNGYNSGVSNGVYGVNASQGVRGDLTAIQITLGDGSTVWILVRCGNPVYPGKPNLPEVLTDNPPPCSNNCEPACPLGQSGTPCKDSPTTDAFPSGNAPIGGGQNADPGSGQYVAPENVVQPPAEPYVPPAPPAPPAAPIVVPSPAPSTLPTVDTGGQNKDGVVPPSGGTNCNPEFQNC